MLVWRQSLFEWAPFVPMYHHIGHMSLGEKKKGVSFADEFGSFSLSLSSSLLQLPPLPLPLAGPHSKLGQCLRLNQQLSKAVFALLSFSLVRALFAAN